MADTKQDVVVLALEVFVLAPMFILISTWDGFRNGWLTAVYIWKQARGAQ